MESCGNGTRDCRGAVMSKVMTKTWIRTKVIWIILMVLVVSTNGSWWSWLWAEDTSSTIRPCIKPLSHMYSANETLDAWKLYMVDKKIKNPDPETAKIVGTFLLFLHDTYTPCLLKEMEETFKKSDDWKTYLKGLIGSEAFLLILPGILALIILIVQCMKSKCCEGGDYKLLRKKTRPHLMR
jgi:hypothetical protein